MTIKLFLAGYTFEGKCYSHNIAAKNIDVAKYKFECEYPNVPLASVRFDYIGTVLI